MDWVRTKIICTMGPAVAEKIKVVELIRAGMSVARLNFSHGTHEEHRKTICLLKEVREELNIPIAIMLDTKGPEIRVGKLAESPLPVKKGMQLKLVERIGKDPSRIPVHPIEVFESVRPGMQILFDDGYLISKVVSVGENEIAVDMQNDGFLKSGKGINIPEAHLKFPSMTEADIADLRFGCREDVDVVAASFIRSAHDVLAIKKLLAAEGKPEILVIAKIENRMGVENFDRIVQAADGIMVARGDLGVEMDLALVPKLQKMMIRKSIRSSKPVVTATQMLESMIVNPRPTRAEVSDVANAIYDATSAVMLSGETAVGKYPVETVQRMREVAKEAEADFDYERLFNEHSRRDYHDVSSAISLAAVKTAYSAKAKAIFVHTSSGATARLLSRLRPSMPVLALTSNRKVYQQLAFNWGLIPLYSTDCKSAREAFHFASKEALRRKILSFGDVVVVTAGSPFGKRGTTNLMMVENIGDILVRGHKGVGPKVRGRVAILLSPEDREADALRGSIAVLTHCDQAFLPLLREAAGVVLQNQMDDSASEQFALLIARTFEKPAICRADGALSVLREGEEVVLDPQQGLVYRESSPQG